MGSPNINNFIVPEVPEVPREIGNTRQSPPAKHWNFTLNNRTIDNIVPEFHKYVFGNEIGASGTPHIQGYVELKRKMRFQQVKALIPEAHWEKCRNIKASIDYAMKDGNYVSNISMNAPVEVFLPDARWCQDIIALLATKPDRRKIYWYWERAGGIGKSDFCKYMHVTYNVKIITASKSADIVTMIEPSDKMIIFDFPRCSNVGTFCPFNALEQIKNGLITDGKLKKKALTVCMNSPHVVIFANEQPDMSKLSKDRWIIIDLNDDLATDSD